MQGLFRFASSSRRLIPPPPQALSIMLSARSSEADRVLSSVSVRAVPFLGLVLPFPMVLFLDSAVVVAVIVTIAGPSYPVNVWVSSG